MEGRNEEGRRKETLVVCVAGLLGLRKLLLLLGFCSFPASEIFGFCSFGFLGFPALGSLACVVSRSIDGV